MVISKDGWTKPDWIQTNWLKTEHVQIKHHVNSTKRSILQLVDWRIQTIGGINRPQRVGNVWFADDPDVKRAEEMNVEGIVGKHFASLLGDVADGFDQGEASNDSIENLVSGAATEPTRAFTFAELQKLEHDFDWECHETTLELLQKNGEGVAARNKKTLWRRSGMPEPDNN